MKTKEPGRASNDELFVVLLVVAFITVLPLLLMLHWAGGLGDG